MKWALQTVAHHTPTYRQIGAHVWAVGIDDVHSAIFSSKDGQIQA